MIVDLKTRPFIQGLRKIYQGWTLQMDEDHLHTNTGMKRGQIRGRLLV